MTLVLVGPEPLELVLASLEGIGSPARGPATIAKVPLPPSRGGEAEVLRSWYGEAWVVGDALEPRGAVAAALLAARLRQAAPDYQTDVELWDVGDLRVLAVTGAAYPAAAAAMRRRVQGTLAEVEASVGSESVQPAVAALRFELLAAARSPMGLASQVGRWHDATGDPTAASRHLAALERVDAGAIRAYLQELQRRGPVRAEVRP